MGGAAHASFSMGALVALGGAEGYRRARSVPSLVAGLGLGGLFILSGVLVQKGSDFEGHALGLATSVALTGAMGPRFAKSRAMMPAGALTILGTAGILYQGKKTMDWSGWGAEE